MKQQVTAQKGLIILAALCQRLMASSAVYVPDYLVTVSGCVMTPFQPKCISLVLGIPRLRSLHLPTEGTQGIEEQEVRSYLAPSAL